MASVLVVDDNLDTCRLLVKFIEELGHQALCAENGRLALAYIELHCPDLLILDVMIPGLSGMAVLDAIRRQPSLDGLPVVMFSASGDPVTASEARRRGADDFWVKSAIDYARLAERLSAYLAPA